MSETLSNTFEPYKTTASVVGGDVYLSLPGDAYIQMSPEANEAEGLSAPQVIVLKDSKDAK